MRSPRAISALLALTLIVSLVSTPLAAQWLKHPTPNVPRQADGKPNLSAPVPRTADGKPDLSGFVHTRDLIAILYEDLSYRQIFLDGRQLPKDPNPSFMAYSVGHWEGDTLVVQTIGFNDRTWLDFGGHPHSEALKVTERFRRRDFGHIDLQETFEDPKVSSRGRRTDEGHA